MSKPDLVITGEAIGAFDHGRLSRFNAWFFTAFDRYINHISRRHKEAAFGGMTPGVVLEIGAGVGANVAYLPSGSSLVAVEPNLAMHPGLRQRCDAAGVPVTVVAGEAEHLPLPDSSVDEVICSLVLCTVGDPARVVAEVRRVLRPGGSFRFVEHVAAPDGHARHLVQRVLERPWAWLFEGCQLRRRTEDLVRDSGFADVRSAHLPMQRSLFYPVNFAVWGVATA